MKPQVKYTENTLHIPFYAFIISEISVMNSLVAVDFCRVVDLFDKSVAVLEPSLIADANRKRRKC